MKIRLRLVKKGATGVYRKRESKLLLNIPMTIQTEQRKIRTVA